MGFESWPSFQKPSEKPKEKKNQSQRFNPETRKNQEESELYKNARSQFGSFFDEFSNSKERIDAILERIEPFFQYIDKEIFPEEKARKIKTDLLECKNISDKQHFLDKVMDILEPAIQIKEAHEDKFEEAQAHAMNEAGGFIEINRLLSYGKHKNIIHNTCASGQVCRE